MIDEIQILIEKLPEIFFQLINKFYAHKSKLVENNSTRVMREAK